MNNMNVIDINNLYLTKIINSKYKNKIKQINHNSKIYYELIISNNLDYDEVYFETNPYICNTCNIFFSVYKKIYVIYLYILKKNLNLSIYDKIIDNLKKYHYIKVEKDLIGTKTHWYIHKCYKCFK